MMTLSIKLIFFSGTPIWSQGFYFKALKMKGMKNTSNESQISRNKNTLLKTDCHLSILR